MPGNQPMHAGMAGMDPTIMQGMHPAMAQQMLLKKMPEPEDPTIGGKKHRMRYLSSLS